MTKEQKMLIAIRALAGKFPLNPRDFVEKYSLESDEMVNAAIHSIYVTIDYLTLDEGEKS